MAQSSGETDVFDCQVSACNRFFVEELPSVTELKPLDPEHEIPKNMKSFKGPIFDITGFDAHRVVSVLVSIVNNKEQLKTNKTFYLLLHNSHENQPNDEIEELFRLKASPTTHQPGNGIVFLRPRGGKTFKTSGKKYDELNGALKAHYEKNKQPDTASFARDIKELFKDNAVVSKDFPQATIEVYLLLLFEIARRLVELEKPSEKKKQYDVLPIGSAIARFVKLLELGSKEISTFEDVFLPKGIFHCFTGKPQDRRIAIDKINKATLDIAKTEKKETLSMKTDHHFKELKEMFRAPALTLAEEFEALKFKDSESSDSMKSSFDAESYTASDYSDTTSS